MAHHFSVIYRDRRFLRIAPLAALGVSTSWSLQGLWAAPWLQEVEGLERATIVQYLGLMALAVCARWLVAWKRDRPADKALATARSSRA